MALTPALASKTRNPISLLNMRLRTARKTGKQSYHEAETRNAREDNDDAEPLCQTDTEVGQTRCCRFYRESSLEMGFNKQWNRKSAWHAASALVSHASSGLSNSGSS